MTNPTKFNGFADYLSQTLGAMEAMKGDQMAQKIDAAIALCVDALRAGLPIMVAGNGGSAADASHIGGELVGRFFLERKGLPCVVFSDMTGTMTAIGNDYGYDQVFVRQIEAFGAKGGVFIGLTTSGNSANIVKAAEKAHELGVKVIGMTGQGGGKLAALSDALLDVPCTITPLVQQGHQVLYHYLCYKVEEALA